MDLLTFRRLVAALLPLISLGLIIGSVVTDDWYKVDYLQGNKDSGMFWEEHSVDYGSQGFSYLQVWSGILGDNYYQENGTYSGDFQTLFDYVLNSSIILSILHIPLLILGMLVVMDRIRPWIPMMFCLILVLGILTVSGYFFLNIEDRVGEHLDFDLDSQKIMFEDDIKAGLKDSGMIGNSFYLLVISSIFPLLSMILLIEMKKEIKPSDERIRDGFFRS
jgi:hypothetical protein